MIKMKRRREQIGSSYNKVAKKYRQIKNNSLLELKILSNWLSLVKGSILDLGCGSGFPVVENIREKRIFYTGVDISEEQINLGRKQYSEENISFLNDDMFNFCESSQTDSIGGVLMLYSLYHLPREYHLKLFEQISRILTLDSPLLFNISESPQESVEENWLGEKGATIFWSCYSKEYYISELKQLGFSLSETFDEVQLFNNTPETHWYLLFIKNKKINIK